MDKYNAGHHEAQVVYNGRPYASIVAWARARAKEQKQRDRASATLERESDCSSRVEQPKPFDGGIAALPRALRGSVIDLLPPIRRTAEPTTPLPPAYHARPGLVVKVDVPLDQRAKGSRLVLAYCQDADVEKRPDPTYGQHPGVADEYAKRGPVQYSLLLLKNHHSAESREYAFFFEEEERDPVSLSLSRVFSRRVRVVCPKSWSQKRTRA